MVSDQFVIDGLVKVKSNTIIETDYYALVTDQFNNVLTFIPNHLLLFPYTIYIPHVSNHYS